MRERKPIKISERKFEVGKRRGCKKERARRLREDKRGTSVHVPLVSLIDDNTRVARE